MPLSPRKLLRAGILLVLLGLLAAGCNLITRGTPAEDPSPSPMVEETPTEEPSPEPQFRFYRVTTAGACLNVRNEPNLQGRVVACVENGTELRAGMAEREADGHTWVRLRGEFTGWASKQFLREIDPPDEDG